MRSRLVAPGQFVAASSIASRLDIVDVACAFCFGDPAWFHVPSSRLVCRRCMPDPWADDGETGRRIAKRLIAIEEVSEPYV